MFIFLKRWKENNQYNDVVKVCLPLVLGMSATTIMEFTDRIFLANYNLDAVAAALPAGIAAFLFMAFLGGIGGYASIFIAQYYGRGEHKRVGSVLWQGIYFCLGSGLIFLLLAKFSSNIIFDLAGHSPEVKELEIKYYTILCLGGVFHVALNTLATFFSGRGITKPVMFVYFIGMLINIPLDYALIFGKFHFPEMGIVGAGIATVVAWVIPTIVLLFMIFTKNHDRSYAVLSNRSFDKKLFIRILRFGIPGSLMFTIDILAFTIFIMLVGRISTLALAATTIVISINSIAFMPSMGVSQGVSILVGQALGKGIPERAKAIVWSSAHLLLLYILLAIFFFLVIPETILSLFITEKTGLDSAELMATCVNLLKIIAAYLLLDSMYMIFSGTLKGAGDNKFIMWCILLASIFLLILPCYLGIQYFNMGIYFAWGWIIVFIFSLFCISAFRYGQGKWQDMLVIEKEQQE